MKKIISICIVIAIILFASVRIITSSYENKHRKNSKLIYISYGEIS